MEARDGTCAEALGKLVEQGVIDHEQADAVAAALRATEESPRARVRWAEVLGYVGGGLVLAAVGTFMVTAWDVWETGTRTTLLTMVAAVLAVAGFAMAGGPALLRRSAEVSRARRRIGGALFALAALSAAFAVAEAVGQALPPGFVPSEATWASAVGLAVAAAAYALLRSAPGLVAVWGMSAFLVGFGVQEAVREIVGPVEGDGFTSTGTGWQIASSAAGTGLLLLGAAGCALAVVGVLRERGTAVGLGAVTSYTGALMLETPVNHAAELAVAAALFTLFALWRTTARGPGAALVFGVLAATVAVPRLVWELTDGEVSAAGVLFVAGAVLLIASAAGIRLRHRATARPDRPRTGLL
ncbi:DUF2157 domain-containing protein [Nocardiopsis kunsanensis]|uniref:DUF2157 domain-containing protein n=1 Tax=Nocardiopsis kunsanensis TaxID=141693 RepID=A0A918XIZ0_9ACTN|nr:DUF2157 domain-containing protein [Nocardiopsis kunsanensis]GHD34378.1 hypothetical protein GCM10007147_39890 [Nocardiopsis kunsanensis]